MKRLDNGNLSFPHRGDPPDCPEGYIKVKGYPYECEPDPAPCIFRDIKHFSSSCCPDYTRPFCKFFNEIILLEKCLNCNEQEN